MGTNIWQSFRSIATNRKLMIGQVSAHEDKQSQITPIGYSGESYYAYGTSVSIGSYAYIEQQGSDHYVMSQAPTIPNVYNKTDLK